MTINQPIKIHTTPHRPTELTSDVITQVVHTQSQSAPLPHKIDEFWTHGVAREVYDDVGSEASPAPVVREAGGTGTTGEQIAKVPVNKNILQ